MTISKENIISAYQIADENGKRMLIALFGKDAVQAIDARPVTERIKTFEDAYNELGSNHPYCKTWDGIYQGNENGDCEGIKDVIAYHKLRIIAAALNEGWKPEFTENEYRYYPYYYFYKQGEYDNLSDEKKEYSRAVGRSIYNAYAYGGLVYANVYYASPSSYTHYGSRLAFKNSELAEYAGKQFIDIYEDFIA